MTLKISWKGLSILYCLCRRDSTQFCNNNNIKNKYVSETETPLACYLDNTVADGWRQSGSVQSPQSGVLTIPTLPCGLWCHTGLCLWMAMCSSPLISNRWWETSKWWSFTKTSSQNKVKGTQKNTKRSHEKNKRGYTSLIAAGCVAGSVELHFALFRFVEYFNILYKHYYGAKTDCISIHKGCKEMFSAQ